MSARRMVRADTADARRCPECGMWIYTAAGPFAEGDRTKTRADWLHWSAEHPMVSLSPVSFPFFPFNAEPVTALLPAGVHA